MQHNLSLQALFPMSKHRNIALFYLLTLCNNSWFIAGNWIFFWTRFMTFGQLGWVDATAFGFGLLMEVPSGAISDLLGKKRTVVVAMFLAAVSVFAFASTTSLMQLWVAFLFAQLGWALYSGAAEALAYDTLVDAKEDQHFDEVISTSGSLATIFGIITTLIGGLLYLGHFRLPHFAWAVAYTLAFLFSLLLTEPKTDTEHFSLKNYIAQLAEGTKQLFKPALIPFVVVIFALMGAHYVYEWGLVRPALATSFVFFDKEQAMLLALFGILSAIMARFIPVFRQFISDKKGLYLLTTLMGLGYVLAYFNLGYYGAFVMFLIAISGQLSLPWVSVVVNKEISSKYRATTLSTVALIAKLPYALLAVVAGAMVEKGTFNVFMLSVGLFVFAMVAVSVLARLLKKAD